MNNRQLKKALAKSNIELFDTKKSKATRTTRETKISSARGIKRTSTKKGFRGVTTKRTKPVTSTVKKTQQAIKTYKPKKKAYSKPEIGRAPKPDLHVYGGFDGVVANKGLAGALNRVERDYPGTYEVLSGWVESGAITWDEVGKHFYRYYFEDRPEGVNFNYLIDQYAVYSEGYESFMTAVRELVEERQQNAI